MTTLSCYDCTATFITVITMFWWSVLVIQNMFLQNLQQQLWLKRSKSQLLPVITIVDQYSTFVQSNDFSLNSPWILLEFRFTIGLFYSSIYHSISILHDYNHIINTWLSSWLSSFRFFPSSPPSPLWCPPGKATGHGRDHQGVQALGNCSKRRHTQPVG